MGVRIRILGCLITALFLIPGVAFAVDATPTFTASTITFVFDKPKGSVDYFEVNETLTLYNYDNATAVSVSGLSIGVNNITGVTAVPSQTAFSISPSQSITINVSFRANSTIAEGSDSGSLNITGSGVTTTNPSITVKIVHPPATINATWEQGWGNVKAGTTFSKTLIVGEVMGYKSASNVSVSITEDGPASLDYTGFLGDFSSFESKTIQVNVSIPERSLKPDSYPLKITISSPTNISSGYENISYVIPVPQMVLSNTTVDLGRVTFETGKETSEKIIFIQEIGGFTPIEGLKIALDSGEVGWITYPEVDYVAPGGSLKVPFKVFLPQDGTLGEKTWRYKLTTDYAGSKDLTAKVFVYFPGIEEALNYLRGVKPLEGYPRSNDIIRSTASLLQKTKGITDAKKIVSVMSIYSGTRTFLTDVSEATRNQERGRIDVAGDNVIRGHRSLIKMKVGEENLGDEELLGLSKDGISAADAVWSAIAGDVLKDLEVAADQSRDSNYKFAVLYYKRISHIYGLMGDKAKEEEYSNLQGQMEELYRTSLTQASESTGKADEDYEKALERTFNFRGESFVINPLSFDFVSEKLRDSIANYKNAEALYRVSGETKDADLLREKIAELEGKRASIVKSFMALGVVLVVLFVGFLVRVSLALQRFRLDDEEGMLGDIVMKPEGGEESS